MSIWTRLGEFVARASASTLTGVLDALRTAFKGNPELRRRVAFSVAMIALSAKMAKADGIVTDDEVRAFHRLFEVPKGEFGNVQRLFNLAKQDVAGFETYAERLARLCGSGTANCRMLEDILDGLFHIATADGYLHEREKDFLARVAEIFDIDEEHFESILRRHVELGEEDPYRILGVTRSQSLNDIRRRYRHLVAESHPDRLIARGVPAEFVAIANSRVAAINVAFERIERVMRVARAARSISPPRIGVPPPVSGRGVTV
jgi:DnaJ like chaperone protein